MSARIDAHQHFWRYSPDTHAWIDDSMTVLKRDFLPKDLAPLLRSEGVDGCIAVQAQQDVAETEWLLSLADQHEFIRGVVGWVDLRAPDLDEQLAELVQHAKLRGIRHVVQSEPDDRFMLREDFMRGIATLAQFALTYDILIFPRQLPAALELARAFPTQPFVLDHIAKPEIRGGAMQPWANDIEGLARCSNVSCKLSGMVTEADWSAWKPADFTPYIEQVLACFGPDRVMFGSDWPVCTVAADYHTVTALAEQHLARLSDAQREGVFSGNAARVYGI